MNTKNGYLSGKSATAAYQSVQNINIFTKSVLRLRTGWYLLPYCYCCCVEPEGKHVLLLQFKDLPAAAGKRQGSDPLNLFMEYIYIRTWYKSL